VPIPVITPPLSPRRIAQGSAITIALSASGSPTSWAATGLPSGLSINADTGVISGTPLAQVLTTASITATNGDGTSAPAQIIFVVEATPPGAGGAWDLELDLDALTGLVSVPGLETQPGEPILTLPRGTNRRLLVGVSKRGVLQDLNPSAEPVSVRMGLKEFEPESLLELTSGPTEKVGSAPDVTRYRVPLRITPASWSGVLGDYEDDAGTEVLALAELQVTAGTVAALYDEEETDSFGAVEGGVSSPAYDATVVFEGVPEFAESTRMRLTSTLTVTDRPLQTVVLVREFDLVFSEGAYELDNLTGALSGQGLAEGGKWRATLALDGVVDGGAGELEVTWLLTTTNDTTQTTYDWVVAVDVSGFSGSLTGEDSISFATAPYLSLRDGSEDAVGGSPVELDTFYDSPAAFFDAIRGAWGTMAGGSDLVTAEAATGTTMRLRASSTSPVREVGFGDSPPAAWIAPAASPGTAGEAKTASVTARLEQLETPDSVPLNLTGRQFLVRVPRDIVPDH
jgi:hypothetical protein